MKTPTLDKPTTVFRSTVTRGIAKDEKAIDRSGGKFDSGLITGFSMISRGEALGHGLWIDSEMLSQVAKGTNAASNGVKARFTHPSLSGDGLGKMSARAFAGRVDGDLVRADAHFLESAHNTPDGDLAGYIMELAEEDPEAFGASISFMRDIEAERKFLKDHGAKQVDPDVEDYNYFDGRYWNLGEFKSPDPLNVKNLPHARLKHLRAVDFVDSPAANPSGLFHTGIFELLEGGEAVLDFVFGVTEQAPEAVLGGVDSSRLKGFVARWAASRGFSANKETEMTIAAPTAPAAPVTTENKPADLAAGNNAPPPAAAPQSSAPPSSTAPAAEASAALGAGEIAPAAAPAAAATPAPAANLGTATAPAATPATPPASAPVDPRAQFQADLDRFTTAFGADNGVKWFKAGMSFESAQSEHIKVLEAKNSDQAQKLAAATTGLGEDAALSGTPGGGNGKPNRLELAVGPNLAKFAAAIDAQASRLTPSKN